MGIFIASSPCNAFASPPGGAFSSAPCFSASLENLTNSELFPKATTFSNLI